MIKEIDLGEKQIHPIIIGFGHCGRNLHCSAINKIRKSSSKINISKSVSAVDLNLAAIDSSDLKQVQGYAELPPIDFFDAERVIPVVHICSPPDTHLNMMRDALEKGHKHIIIEKPMASNISDAKKMVELGESSDANVALVANWIHSALVEKLMSLVDSGKYGRIVKIEIDQHKPRFAISKSRKDEHIFDIEMPHQIALAQYIGGEPLSLLSSHVEDMVHESGSIANMGAGSVVLSHHGGALSLLCTKLNHHSRERSLKVTFERGDQFVGYFPVSRDDSYSQYQFFSHTEVSTKKIIFDEPLTRCIEYFYLGFLKKSMLETRSVVANSLQFHLNTIEVIEQAKGIPNHSPCLKVQAV